MSRQATRSSLEQRILANNFPGLRIEPYKERSFLLYCESCKRKHRMMEQQCGSCGGRGGWTPQPVSSRVADECRADYRCDGCYTYETEHLAV